MQDFRVLNGGNAGDCRPKVRFTISLDSDEEAAPRIRAVLKITGAKNIRITQIKTDEKTESKPKSDAIPTSLEALAVASLFGRPAGREWSDPEKKLFVAAKKRGAISLETIAQMTRYYQSERKKSGEGIHRRDLLTFLRNVDGENDRATQFATKRKPSMAHEWLPSTPQNIVLMAPEPVPTAAQVQAELTRMKTL